MSALDRLSPRERQVLALKAEGLSYKLVAYVLHIELNAALGRGRHIIRKLGVANIREAVALYTGHALDLHDAFPAQNLQPANHDSMRHNHV
jgi:DNA-binding CsgD family transcriptional regulator